MATKQTKRNETEAAKGTVARPPKLDVRMVRNWVIGCLVREQALPDDSDETKDNAAAELIELWEIDNGKRLVDWEYTAEAAQSLDEYIVAEHYKYDKPEVPKSYAPTGFTVACTIPAKTPGTTVTYTLQCSSLTEDVSEAMEQARNDLAEYVTSHNRLRQPSERPASGNGHIAPEPETFQFEALRAEIYNGKMVFRLMPTEGRWTKFGIPLYGDQAMIAHIRLDQYNDEGLFELAGTATVLYKKNGSPYRAVDVEVE